MLPTAYDVMSLLTRKLQWRFCQKKKKNLVGDLNMNLNIDFKLIYLKCFDFKSINFRCYFKFGDFKLLKSFVNFSNSNH